MKKIYDVIIIGGGIIGAACAYEISKYNLDALLLEKNPYLAQETSKGNSGVIHGGFDPEPWKIEARLNIEGSKIWQNEIFKNLTFPHAQVNSIVLAFDEHEMEHIQMLYDRGIENKISPESLSILTTQQILEKEPLVNPNVVGGLYATNSYAIDPVKATICFMGVFVQNGNNFLVNSEVTKIEFDQKEKIFAIQVNNKDVYYTKTILNVAGHYADVMAEIAGYPDFKQKTRRGEYRVLLKTERNNFNNILFMVPTIHGKGVVVAPTLDGHVLIGPTATENVPKNETNLSTINMYEYIGKIGKKIVPNLEIEKTIATFAGSRPIDIETNDFVIRAAKDNVSFINVAGMQSPGLSAAPVIAKEVVELIKAAGLKLDLKTNFKNQYKVIW